jgi:hypothetical protein
MLLAEITVAAPENTTTKCNGDTDSRTKYCKAALDTVPGNAANCNVKITSQTGTALQGSR